MKDFPNLNYYTHEKTLEKFLSEVELPTYAKISMLESFLFKEKQIFFNSVNRETEEFIARRDREDPETKRQREKENFERAQREHIERQDQYDAEREIVAQEETNINE